MLIEYTLGVNEGSIESIYRGYQSTLDCGCLKYTSPGGYSLIWAIQGCAAGQDMVFWCHCPKQGIQFDLPLS